MTRQRPVILCILDGWGHGPDGKYNSISQAETPNWDQLWTDSPHSLLETSGEAVGLPLGQMGNSEVGHMNLGAGRIIYQDLPRIDKAIEENAFKKLPPLQDYMARLKGSGGTAHILGLFSPGGVHSHQEHMLALAKTVLDENIPIVFHPFLDGRDTPPQSAPVFLSHLIDFTKQSPKASVGTVGGRYYAMDRDQRWDRIEKAYQAMVCAPLGAPHATTPLEALEESYSQDVTDEFVIPTVIEGYKGMQDGDGLLMSNFRSDRARQILQAFCDPDFKGFEREETIDFAACLGMVEYSAQHTQWLGTLFSPLQPENTLGEIISDEDLHQLRIAETEKYAHVTFFFNGGREDKFEGEDRILVPSPSVATYDLKPEMAAFEMTQKLTQAIASERYDFIVVNYANTDMVGHTGNQKAAEAAVRVVDECLGQLMSSVKEVNGCLAVTADHGNVETMLNPETEGPHTAHTLNPVPFVLYNVNQKVYSLQNGKLADVAPTLLELMDIKAPNEFTGKSLISL